MAVVFPGAMVDGRQREWHHAGLGREIPAVLLPLVQARLLARHLRGDSDAYLSWVLS